MNSTKWGSVTDESLVNVWYYYCFCEVGGSHICNEFRRMFLAKNRYPCARFIYYEHALLF